jgi:hypothetical protein
MIQPIKTSIFLTFDFTHIMYVPKYVYVNNEHLIKIK